MPRVVGGERKPGSIPGICFPAAREPDSRLRTPPGHDGSIEAAQVGESSVSPSCAPSPPPSPNGRLPAPLGGSAGKDIRSEISQRGSSRGCHVRGGHDGPESRLRPRESVGVLAFAEFPRTGRHPHSQASAWGSRGPPVFRRALRAPWPPAGGSQDSRVRRKFPLFSPGGVVCRSSFRGRLKDLGCWPLVV